MSIIKAKRPDGSDVTCVQPDSATLETVADLKSKGYTDIHDAETGKKYES